MRTARKRIAEVISIVLNAPLVALGSFAVLISFLRPTSPVLLFIVSSFFGSALPLGIILCMTKRGVITDVYASDRRTRTKPFLGALPSYVTGVIILTSLRAPQSLVALMACYFINSLVMMLISHVWKISIHASGIAGPATFLVSQMGIEMLPFFTLLFPVAWARIELGAHDMKQLVAGALLTVALTLAQVELYLR